MTCDNPFLFYKQALLSAVVKRIKGFIKLKIALGALHEALPDATSEEIQAYDDECAICRASASFILFACDMIFLEYLFFMLSTSHGFYWISTGTNGKG